MTTITYNTIMMITMMSTRIFQTPPTTTSTMLLGESFLEVLLAEGSSTVTVRMTERNRR